MKYYTYELWKKINSLDKTTRDEAERKWNENDALYTQIYNQVKEKLPKKFVKIYEQHGFHDWKIGDLNIVEDKLNCKYTKVEMIVKHVGITYVITFNCVSKILINYLNDHFNKAAYFCGIDTWGYSEFYQLDNKVFSFEALLVSGSSILIHFRKLEIKRVY
jgi:hypothetical protein